MQDIFNQAFEYHQKGQLTQARDLYEQILRDEPNNHEVWDLLGILYTQVGQYDKALISLQKAIDLKPLPFYVENLAKMYFKKEDYQNAVELYEILIKNNPNNYENTFNLAMACKNNGQYDKAKEMYYKAIELNPESTESYFNLAYLCFNENDTKGAIECYKKVLEINPDDWETMYFLSLAYMQDKNYKDGLKCFEQRLCRQSAIVSQEKTYPNLMKQKPIWTGKEDLSDKTLYTYSGKISAGINLKDLDFDVNDSRKTITVKYPPIQILAHDMDQGFEFYDIKKAVFNRSDFNDFEEFRVTMKKQVEEKLMARDDFIKDAQDNAETIMEGLLTASGQIGDYTIKHQW